jgi:SNF2 family DNA or RNA helicase
MASNLHAVLFIKADGTALNLPVANQVFPLDPWSNPMVEEQMMDRSWRIDT